MEFIKNRLSEKFTWLALFGVISTFTSINLTEPQQYAIAFLGMVIAGSPDEKLKEVFARKKL